MSKFHVRLLAVFGVLFIMAFGFNIYKGFFSDREWHDVYVKEKLTKMSKDDDGEISERYLVLTDVGEFEVTDTIWKLDWRATSRFNQIEEGATCDFKTIGWRWGFKSWYPNIYHAECR